jgi:hypothetical protein
VRQLLGRNPIGLSDNGDYGRVLTSIGLLRPPGFPANGFLTLRFTYGDMPGGGYGSSLNPLLRLVTWVPRAFGAESFDIRWLAGVYAVLLGLLVWFVVRALPGRPVQVIGGILLVVITTDTAFVSYFGSFFSEPGSMLALLFVVGVLLRLRGRPAASPVLVAALVSSGLLLATVKTQNVVLGPLLAVGVLALRPRRLALPAAVLLLVVPLVYAGSQPSGLRQVNLYNAVFYTLLPRGDDPAGDLRALGMDPALARLSGTQAFQDNRRLQQPSFAAFARDGGQAKLVRFYASRPSRAVGLAVRGSRGAALARPLNLGNRARLVGTKPKEVACEQCLYSVPSRWLRPVAPILLPALYLGALVLAFARRRRASWLTDTLRFLTLGGMAEFAVALLGEGDYELAKHLYLFDVMTAFLVVFAVLALLERGVRQRRPAPSLQEV